MVFPPNRHDSQSTIEETEALVGADYYESHDSRENRDIKEKVQEHAGSMLKYAGVGVQSGIRLVSRSSMSRFIGQKILSLVIFFLPSWITALFPRSAPASKSVKEKPLHPTAYLDGLRGVAALVVYVFHWSYLWFPFLRDGWGIPGGANLFLQLPVIRAMHSGRASVTVFFVISGYVITIKTLTMIYKGQHERVLDTLAGSLFRRPFRLYLPIIPALCIIFVFVRMDMLHLPPRFETFNEQLDHFIVTTIDMVNPFRAIPGRSMMYFPPYEGHLWTIPVEFKGSLMVFAMLLAFSKAKRWVHMSAVTIGMLWLVYLVDLDQALFCAGLLLAELSLLVPPDDPKINSWFAGMKKFGGLRSPTMVRHAITITLFIISLHLFSYPEVAGPESPGFRTLTRITPERYKFMEDFIQLFWIAIGSVLFVLSLMYSPPVTLPHLKLFPCLRLLRRSKRAADEETTITVTSCDGSSTFLSGPRAVGQAQQPHREPLLQAPFTTPLAQYLGHVSYAMYLAHGSLNYTLGVRYLYPAVGRWAAAEQGALQMREAGMEDEANNLIRSEWRVYLLQAFWGSVVNTFVLFWISDVFWRAVDMRAVEATRWLCRSVWRKD
ncbi:hypothetical protein BX600DRAFT_433265 [Xylariales sp. PMI_506]|nr:hypothetical protein BX600DRAFT_433265 [Xylariales sp. PMI_506]